MSPRLNTYHRSILSRTRRRMWVVGLTVALAVAVCVSFNLQLLQRNRIEPTRQNSIVATVQAEITTKTEEKPLLDAHNLGLLNEEEPSPPPRHVKLNPTPTATSSTNVQTTSMTVPSTITIPNVMATEKQRSRIPMVLLAGTQKASTTSLALYLKSVAKGCFSDASRGFEGYGKESHFFDEKFAGGLRLYRDLFQHCDRDAMLLDGTPETMLYPERVHEIYSLDGTASMVRIIFVLREPVSREISWYQHQLRYARLPNPPSWAKDPVLNRNNGRSFKSFIQVQRANVIRTIRQGKSSRSLYGYYAQWLRRWSKLFDRRQILVVSYDELVHNPESMLRRVHSFLNVSMDENVHRALPRENTNSHNTSNPPCAHQLELADYFAPLNTELYQFMQRSPGPPMEQRPFPKFVLSCPERIPSVLLAGVPIAGTLSIARHLKKQKAFCFATKIGSSNETEEPHILDNPRGTLDGYRKLFRSCKDNNQQLIVDATPNTILYPDRVRQWYDQHGNADAVKLIFILRNPVERQLAWYLHQVATVHQSSIRSVPAWAKSVLDVNGTVRSFFDVESDSVQRDTNVVSNKQGRPTAAVGNYVHWIEQWSQHFDRRSQILILSYQELIQNPKRLLQRISMFLNQTITAEPPFIPPEPMATSDLAILNCLTEDVQLQAVSSFEDSNQELYDFLETHPGPDAEQRPFPHFTTISSGYGRCSS